MKNSTSGMKYCAIVAAAGVTTLSVLWAQSQPSNPSVPGSNPAQVPNNPNNPARPNPPSPHLPGDSSGMPGGSPMPGITPISPNPGASIAPLATPSFSPMASPTPLIR